MPHPILMLNPLIGLKFFATINANSKLTLTLKTVTLYSCIRGQSQLLLYLQLELNYISIQSGDESGTGDTSGVADIPKPNQTNPN